MLGRPGRPSSPSRLGRRGRLSNPSRPSRPSRTLTKRVAQRRGSLHPAPRRQQQQVGQQRADLGQPRALCDTAGGTAQLIEAAQKLVAHHHHLVCQCADQAQQGLARLLLACACPLLLPLACACPLLRLLSVWLAQLLGGAACRIF